MTLALTFCSIAFALAFAYFFAKATERQAIIENERETIKSLREELKLWQNKALPQPLGFETRERPKKEPGEKGNSPIPRIPTRAEIEQRRLKRKTPPTLYKQVETKYQDVAEKAKEIVENGNQSAVSSDSPE